MLVLMFYIHTQAYYTEAQSLECVIPNIATGLTPTNTLMWFSYKQQRVPLLDLCLYYIQRPAALSLGTRMGVVKASTKKAGGFLYWAFRAENMRKLYFLEKNTALGDVQTINGLSCKYLALEKIEASLLNLAKLSPCSFHNLVSSLS